RAVAGSARLGAAPEAGREGRSHHPRVGAADGAHRRHQDPAGRRDDGRRQRQRRGPWPLRRLRRWRGELGAALSRPGTAGGPPAARDRPGRQRHPPPGRRRDRDARRAGERQAPREDL
ncbi:MAG: Inner membrane protein YqiK, partial [uncultured Ramlibacter sp.]